MGLEPLKGFRPLNTHHCVTGSMRHVYEFHEYPISEDLLLGLGAGVGFVYWHMKGTLPILGGRANVGRPGEEGLERTAGIRTGVRVRSFHSGSSVKAEKAAVDLLAKGEPVMVVLDMGFLPYLNLPQGYHFGGHAVVLAGHDPGSRQVLVADRDGTLHPVTLDTLARARGSQFKPFPPGNKWFTFDFSHKRAAAPKEVRQAIHEVSESMLQPPIANLGVKGIRIAAARVLEWPKIMERDTLANACMNAFIFIDAKGGTGGGIFRYMYGRFLKEAASIVGDNRLASAGESMRMIGDKWQEIADVFQSAHTAPNPSILLPEASERMLKIADREHGAWKELLEIVGG